MKILGLDGGTASIGWAVVDVDVEKHSGKIIACGTRMFNSPEGKKDKDKPFLKNAERRKYRGQRRVIRRRRQRMKQIRQLFAENNLVETTDPKKALAGNGTDPWKLRAEALDRLLDAKELALALGHIAKHRGFKSNRKGGSSQDTDKKTMLKAIEINSERLEKYETVGEMLYKDPDFEKRKRNREKDYTCSILRDDQEKEVEIIFDRQRRKRNKYATTYLEKKFINIAFFQRPIQSSENMVGKCTFIKSEKRASAFAPSFEKFRFLQKLVNLEIVSGSEKRPLTPDEIDSALKSFAKYKKYTYKQLRNRIGISKSDRFNSISPGKEKNDFIRQKKGAAEGTKTLIDILEPVIGEKTKELLDEGETLDKIITAIAFNEDTSIIRKEINKIQGLESNTVDALCKAVADDKFNFVKGTGHISNAAARRLIPHLRKGLRYHEACKKEGWNHAAARKWKLEDIKSPVAQKAAREMMKQVSVLEHEHGPFDAINIEMSRHIGKSIKKRAEIKIGMDKQTEKHDESRKSVSEILGKDTSEISDDEVLRYELWKEQGQGCLYSGKAISVEAIYKGDNSVQVDHLLPWSRFGDNSFHNKTLCLAGSNQNKKDLTPFEYFASDEWDNFVARVDSCKSIKGMKKRNYLLMDAEKRQEEMRKRNMNDTRYALRVVLGLLQERYCPDVTDTTDANGKNTKRRRVFARPGQITAALRKAWGLEQLKKDDKGERIPDDRHHALDAIITACCSESMLQYATRHAQKMEEKGKQFELSNLNSPWGSREEFRQNVIEAFEGVFVSRPERGRLRGKAHGDTIRQIRQNDQGEEELYTRKSVDKLEPKDLENIPIPKPYGKIRDPKKLRDEMVKNLREWIENGKNKEKRPRSAKGDPIKKVRLKNNDKKAIEIRGGSANRESIVRVDVFSKNNKKGEEQFYIVPIYINDIYNNDETLKKHPPNKAVSQKKVVGSKWTIHINSIFPCILHH